MKKIFLTITIITIITVNIFSQDSIYTFNNQVFHFENNNWYVLDEATSEKFKVNPRSFTVKLKEQIPYIAFENFCQAQNISIIRKNKLGYIDIHLPENSNFRNFYGILKNKAFFENIHLNSYGKSTSEETNTPNDSFFDEQYYLFDYYEQGWPTIDILGAWDIENGSTNQVIVAVIGMGFDLLHEDLFFTSGYNYVLNEDPNWPIYTDIEQHHETAVAGIIAAKTNNEIGISGIAGGWYPNNPGAVIMPLKVGEGMFYNLEVIDDAIIYAAENGAKVINMSFAITHSAALEAAVKYAYNQYGCILISTTGHHGGRGLPYPASYSEVLAIGGIMKNWSRLGRMGNNDNDIDAVAPAEDIFTTFNDDDYGNIGWGTSFAAPQVAGISALLLSKHPNLIPMDIKNIVKHASVYEPNMENDPLKFGNGLIKADRALKAIIQNWEVLPPYPNNLQVTAIQNQNPVLTWPTILPLKRGDIIEKYNIYRSIGTAPYKFIKIGEVNHNSELQNHTWVDNSYTVDGGGVPYYRYRVTSEDDKQIQSITSNEVVVNAYIGWKINNEISEIFDYNLLQNFPNPFNPVTTISYSIKETGLVTLSIYNILGQLLSVAVNEVKEQGNHNTQFDASLLSSGVYIYQLKVNDFISSKKMVITK